MKFTPKVKSSGDGRRTMKKINKELEKSPEILVGVPQDAIPYPDGTSVALVAAVHEFGTAKVPERSFIRTSIEKNLDKYKKLSERGMVKVVDGKLGILQLAGLIGTEAQGDVQDEITKLKSPALAEATIKEKKKKGGEND